MKRKPITSERLGYLADLYKNGVSTHSIIINELLAEVERLKAYEPKGDIETLNEVERAHILRAYESSGRHQGRTADVLGMGVRTVHEKLKEYGVLSREKEPETVGAEA